MTMVYYQIVNKRIVVLSRLIYNKVKTLINRLSDIVYQAFV